MSYFLRLIFKNLHLFLTNRNYRTFHWLAFRYGNVKRYSPRKINFSGMRFYVPDTMSFIWQYKEIFVDEYYCFNYSGNSPLIYDCGANIGTSCAYFKKLYPSSKVIAFEADPSIRKILKKNIDKNNLSDITIIPKAVWTHNNGIEMLSEGSDAASIYGEGEGEKIIVESVRLNQLLEQEKIIDFLKMDIEGAESEVLKDCKDHLHKIKEIFIEFHSFRNHDQELAEILHILKAQGFRYSIYSSHNKARPYKRLLQKEPYMDLQLNIFASRLKG